MGTINWKQNAEDAQGILCDIGDLLRECYEVLNKCGQVECAEKIRAFGNRVHQCMVSCEPWVNVAQIEPSCLGPDPNAATQQLAIALGALTIALIDKGVITQDEYERAYAQATGIIDQEFAFKRDAKSGLDASPDGV